MKSESIRKCACLCFEFQVLIRLLLELWLAAVTTVVDTVTGDLDRMEAAAHTEARIHRTTTVVRPIAVDHLMVVVRLAQASIPLH